MLVHQCEENHFSQSGIQVIWGPTLDEVWQHWILRVARITTEQDVIDGEALEIGEELCVHAFVINYCPFCE